MRKSIEEKIQEKLDKLHGSDKDIREYIYSNLAPEARDDIDLEPIIKSDERIKSNLVESFITHQDILVGGSISRYSVSQYINACKYTSFLLMGMDSLNAWRSTFPEEYNALYQKYRKRGDSDKTIQNKIKSKARSFDRRKIVSSILKRSYVPLYVNNIELAEKALHTLNDLRENSKNDRIKMESSKIMLEYLQPPKELLIKEEISHTIENKSSSPINELKSILSKISKHQVKRIELGETIEAIDAELIESRYEKK